MFKNNCIYPLVYIGYKAREYLVLLIQMFACTYTVSSQQNDEKYDTYIYNIYSYFERKFCSALESHQTFDNVPLKIKNELVFCRYL